MNENETSLISAASRQPMAEQAEMRQERELLQAVLDRLAINQWDLLLVGDGSGSGWAQCCGWAAVLIDRNHLLDRNLYGRRFFYGAADPGSVNFAESMPYMQAINWYDVQYGRQLLHTKGVLNVHVLTDSQVIANWGNRATQPTTDLPRKAIPAWAAIREYSRLGYHFTMHWAPRMTTELNWAADLIAGLARRHVKEAMGELGSSMADRAAAALDRVTFCDPATGQSLSPYHINPQAEMLHVPSHDSGQ